MPTQEPLTPSPPPQFTTPQAPHKLLLPATRAIFFILGFVMGAWAPFVPFAKSRAGLNEAELGSLLLCIGFGSLITMPLAGPLTGKLGCRPIILAAALAIILAFPLLAVLSARPALAAIFFVLGAGIGTADVAINIQALSVEKTAGKTLMSGFHGMYSVGGISGACLISTMLGLGFPAVSAALSAAAVMLALTAAAAPQLLPYSAGESGPLFARPRGPVLAMGVLCFVVFLTEGAMLDWSAVFLSAVKQVPQVRSGWGYAAYSVMTSLTRLNGDRIVARLGAARTLLIGGLWAALAMSLAVLAPTAPLSIFGFALVGLGVANLAPTLFRLGGAQNAMPPALAVATIATLGYAGILAGPAAIGHLAQAFTLTTALLVLSSTLAVAAILGYRLAR